MNNYRLHISNSVEHHFIDIERILYIRSNGNYSNVYLDNGTEIQNIPKQLGQIARIINNTLPCCFHGALVQVGRYYIVNTYHIQTIHTTKKIIIFDTKSPIDNSSITISPSSESLSVLCDLMSKDYPTTTDYPTHAQEDDFATSDMTQYTEDGIQVLGLNRSVHSSNTSIH